MMKTSEPKNLLRIKDAYTLYEEEKKRRYSLLFSVNGGAFAIAQLLNSTGNKLLGDLLLAHLAIGMGIFTILMVWDIYAFGEKTRDRFYYHRARFYAVWLGRWGCVDPIGIRDGVNLYAYVKGDPIRFSDSNRTSIIGDAVEGIKSAANSAWEWTKQAVSSAWEGTKKVASSA